MTDEHFRIRFKRYASVVIRWLVVSSFVFIATMAGGIYVTNHVLARVYSATASLQVQGQIVGQQAYSGWAVSSPQSRAVEAEFESIESPQILREVVSNLSLDRAWADRVYRQSDPLTTDEALHYLESHLRLTFRHESNVVEVTALSDDPLEAANIANNVVDLYKQTRDNRNPLESVANAQASTGSAQTGAVQITARAPIPTEPTSPNKRFCYALSAGLAGLMSVMVASALEVCLLISRAEIASQEMLAGR